MNYRIVVRGIQGMPLANSSQKVYVYDGLYQVVECLTNNTESGYRVCHFKLLRVQGQRQLGSKTVHIAAETKAKLVEGIMPFGYVSLDISKKEKVSVLFFNDVDKQGDPMMDGPLRYEYLKFPEYPSSSKQSDTKGCECHSTCSDKRPCNKWWHFCIL